MTIWAIVPVKPFLRSKSRLARVLSPQERAGLSREFLGHALDVLAQVPAITQTLVISRDSEALALAREYRAYTVTESGAPDLNQALRRATEAARGLGADAVLILPTDLPFLSASDVQQLIADEGAEPTVVIAPDRRESGTNALFVRPPGWMDYAFGRGSFRRHLDLAAKAGAQVRLCRLPGAALDVDVPEDLAVYQAAKER
ncbi:MAG TPA: 2-phospho-L-lactate guanylyltransferase [Anaerolineales bacterium]|nr:2-phospho-L-lactate guanylyltransferase [Anaerolineales bacterium]